MWKLYNDSACTDPFSGVLQINSKTNLTDNPQDFTLYFANIDDDPLDAGSVKLQAQSAPGTDPVQIYIVDSSPGSGHEAGDITLALTPGDLAVNTPGAPLNLGVTLTSGVSNALPIYIRAVNTVTTVSSSTELSIRIVATVATST